MRKAERRVAVPPSARREGLAYAFDELGLELPVIDVTHQAFRLDPSEAELAARVESAAEQMKAREKANSFAQRVALKALARRSILARGIGEAAGGYVGGMSIYRLKLGPDNLGPRWARAIDRGIADSMPCYSARLRLRDCATLLAEAAASSMAQRQEAALRLVNVAGGAAMDSLNALVLLRRGDPGALEGRRIVVDVLDLDESGPAFAKRALAALMENGRPLHGLDASLSWRPYDWRDPRALGDLAREIGEEGSACAISSEGGLFEYGSDEEIAANLRAVASGLSRGGHGFGAASRVAWIGTISRVDGQAAFLNGASRSAARLRPLPELESLARGEGWLLERRIDCPLSSSFRLAAPIPGPSTSPSAPRP